MLHASQDYRAQSSDHLIDEQILAALDGTADQSIRSHLARCPGCAARADELIDFERQLRFCLYRALCPSSEELLAYIERKLNPEQFIRITEHLIDCKECVKDVHLLEEASSIPSHIQLLDMHPAACTIDKKSRHAHQKADLSLGLCSANREIQYVYHANNMSLTLSIAQEGRTQQRSLSGLLMMQDEHWRGVLDGWACLSHNGQMLDKSVIDTSGFFSMRNLVLGRHILSVQTNQCEIVIDPLDI